MTVVRAPRPADARAMAEVWFAGETRALAESYPDGHPPEWAWMTGAEALLPPLVPIVSPGVRCASWVAVSAGRVLGVGWAGPAEAQEDATTVGELRMLYTHPDAWGAGLGSRLHDAIMAFLREGFSSAQLWVIEGNARARGFYEHRGWVEAGEWMRAPSGLPLVRYVNPLHA